MQPDNYIEIFKWSQPGNLLAAKPSPHKQAEHKDKEIAAPRKPRLAMTSKIIVIASANNHSIY